MKKKSKLYRDGKYVRDFVPGEDYTLADGESVRVEMNFIDAMPVFDSAGHKPGFVSLTDTAQDQRAQAYLDRKAAVSRQWQDVAPLPAAPLVADVSAAESSAIREARLAFASPVYLTGDARMNAYARRNAVLERQWEAAR